jgi:hypothetical protein
MPSAYYYPECLTSGLLCDGHIDQDDTLYFTDFRCIELKRDVPDFTAINNVYDNYIVLDPDNPDFRSCSVNENTSIVEENVKIYLTEDGYEQERTVDKIYIPGFLTDQGCWEVPNPMIGELVFESEGTNVTNQFVKRCAIAAANKGYKLFGIYNANNKKKCVGFNSIEKIRLLGPIIGCKLSPSVDHDSDELETGNSAKISVYLMDAMLYNNLRGRLNPINNNDYDIKNINACPWTNDSSIKYTNSGIQNTTLLRDGSAEVYDAFSSETGFNVRVKPIFDNLTWVGTAPTCSSNNGDSCKSTNFDNIPELRKPRIWTGYYSGSSMSDNNLNISNGSCNNCSTGRQVLCSLNSNMSIQSCPGYDLSNPPEIGNLQQSNAEHPHGVGTCYYPLDIIKNDDDLQKMINVKNNNKLPHTISDTLISNYCYNSTDYNCKIPTYDGHVISGCIRYKSDSRSGELCRTWKSTLDNSKLPILDSMGGIWCDNNQSHALCDCLKANFPNNSRARDVYNSVTQVNQNGTPVSAVLESYCWFKPCINNPESYAITKEVVQAERCPSTVNICTNSVSADTDSFITNSSQICNFDNPTEAEKTEVKTNWFIIGIIIFIVMAFIISIILTFSKSRLLIPSTIQT